MYDVSYFLFRAKQANPISIMRFCRFRTQRNCRDALIDYMGLCRSCSIALSKERIEEWILQGEPSPPSDPDPAFEWAVVFDNGYFVTKNWKTNTLVTLKQIKEGIEWEERNRTCPPEERQVSSREFRDEYSFYPVAEHRVKSHNKIRATGGGSHPRSTRTQDEMFGKWAQR